MRFAIKGDIVYTPTPQAFVQEPDAYVLCNDGLCCGVVKELPADWKQAEVFDYTGKLIMPGLVDLHAHAPQYAFRGMGMDLQLLDWLNTYTFPEEAKYARTEYAARMYEAFAQELRRGPTTNAVIFGTLHTDSDLLLADLLEKTGVRVLLGKVNMNRNSPEYLTETAAESLSETERFIHGLSGFTGVRPIITPRFVPSCDAELMTGLAELAEKYHAPIQSHLDENTSEVQWVHELHPDCDSYADVYRRFGLLDNKTVMAHCVHVTDAEQNMLKSAGTFIAHCPQSNVNLCSGIAPAVHYLTSGQRIGLGTDIAAGASLNMFRAASDAIRVSKMRYFYTKQDRPLTVSEAFYLATKGGGAYFDSCGFAKTGSFENGYSFDAIVLDDTEFIHIDDLSLAQRTERILYLSDYHTIKEKFVNGRRIYEES
jgi:guanine deaminase